MNDRPNLVAGQIIKKGTCACCGRETFIKLDRNFKAYHICTWPVIETGNKCGYKEWFTLKQTDALLANYGKKKAHDERDVQDEPEPVREREPETERSGSFLSDW